MSNRERFEKHARTGVCSALLLPVILASSGCASRADPGVPAQDAAAAITMSDMPAEVGRFRVTDIHRYPDPRAGTLYRFRNDSALMPDVYVYPINRPSLNPAREEGMNFGRVLTAQRNQRRIDSFVIMKQGPLEHTSGSTVIPGWHVYAVLSRRGEKMDSHMHLFVIGNRMLKVRSTYPQNDVDPAELEEFVAALLRSVTGGGTR